MQESHAALTDLAVWLIDCVDARRPLPDIFEGLCGRLVGAGLPLFRATLGLETLHPEDSGTQLTWRDGALARRRIERAGILTSEDYLTSPTWVVDQTGKPFRWRTGEPTEARPLIENLAADGMTDYFMLPLPILDDTRTATMSYATRAPGGFDDDAIALLQRASTCSARSASASCCGASRAICCPPMSARVRACGSMRGGSSAATWRP